MNRLIRNTSVLATAITVALVCTVGALAAAGYTLYGDAQLVSPGFNSPTAAQIRSDASIAPSYGGVDFNVPAGLTVADLDNLSTDYKFTAGSCGGGSPRFQINVTNGTTSGNIFAYIGSPPNYTGCPPSVWLNSGNLAAPANLVDAAQIGGGPYMPYAAVQTAYGSYEVTGIQVVVDGSWLGSTQTLHVDNIQINNSTTTFENADSCKKGGYQDFTSAPGPFKNQGQCVSYFAKGGQ